VADIMTREVFSVDETATLREIADLLKEKNIKRSQSCMMARLSASSAAPIF
jgi:CBS domain-containing protein